VLFTKTQTTNLKAKTMIRKSLLTFAIAAASLTAATSALAADPKDVLASFHSALVAGDKPKALELMAPDVAIYESGFVEGTRNEYASHHLADDMAFAKTTTRKVLKHSERIEGNFAIIWEETETTGTSRGKDVHFFGTETAVLEKKADTWSITHVHWSSRKAK
jgi:ketosteroid isomerase-like protein